MADILECVNHFVWGVPALVSILGVGIYLAVRTRFVQFRCFPNAIIAFLSGFKRKNKNENGTSPYRALCTALAATVGTGNLAGVAGAIAIGGPGAVFWMWICAVLGMGIKFAEATLAVQYRVRSSVGQWIGGPMYIIEKGLGTKWRWMAGLYCFFGVVAAFGVGNATQINTLIGSVNAMAEAGGLTPTFGSNLLLGALLAIFLGFMLRGGATRIGAAAEMLVPLASVTYIVLGLGVLLLRWQHVNGAFVQIFSGAFRPEAVTGGAVGSILIAVRIGACRGVFTNEAGMGTASIAHASAEIDHPVKQGFMGIIEVFLDTVVICTITALVILCSGIQIPYGIDSGIRLTSSAFAQVYGNWVHIPITVCICLFAFATVLGWGLYGGRCAQYLFGEESWQKFVALQLLVVVIGAVTNTGTVWMLADIVNGLMALPNLTAIALLMPRSVKLLEDYKKRTQI